MFLDKCTMINLELASPLHGAGGPLRSRSCPTTPTMASPRLNWKGISYYSNHLCMSVQRQKKNNIYVMVSDARTTHAGSNREHGGGVLGQGAAVQCSAERGKATDGQAVTECP